MLKIAIGFAVFAALVIFVMMKGGNIDMGGEKHGIEVSEPAASAASK